MKLALALLLLFATATAHARLGETLEELAKRFGPPVLVAGRHVINPSPPPWDKPYGYEKDGFKIRVHLVNGRCEYIVYYRLDNRPLTEAQALALRQANDPGTGWVPVTPPKYFYPIVGGRKPDAAWHADDYRRFAALTGSMAFYSKTWVDTVAAAKAAEQAAQAKKQDEANALPKGF